MKIYAPQISGSLAINGTSIGNFNNLVSTSSFNQYTSSISTGSLATTGSNTFVGNQTMSGSIIPAVTNTYDLGDVSHQFRHLYLSSGSLYINGTKVLGTTGQELQITTDAGQSLKILEAGSDTITLQSADGNITLATSGGGDVILDPTSGIIALKGTTTLYAGNKILSSDGGAIQVGNDLGITGSLVTTGNINGINLTTFSSSVASTLLNQNTATSSYETKGSGIVSGSSQITYTSISSIPGGIVSGSSQVTTLLPTGTVSGSSQIVGILGALNTFSASASSSLGDIQNYTSSLRAAFTASGANVTFSGNVTIPGNLTIAGTQTIVNSTTIQLGDNIIELNGNGVANGGLLVKDPTAPNMVSGSLLWDSTNDYWKAGALGAESKLLRAEGDSIVSGSSQINFTQLSGISNGIVSGSSQTIANLPTGTVSGSSQITYTGISSIPVGIVSGSSQITYTNISSIPAGIVSGSSQITYANISSIPGGIVSGSAQTIFNLPTGTISGSSQVNVMSTTNIARLATTGSNAFTGNQTITGTINTISIPNDLFAFQFLLMGG